MKFPKLSKYGRDELLFEQKERISLKFCSTRTELREVHKPCVRWSGFYDQFRITYLQ